MYGTDWKYLDDDSSVFAAGDDTLTLNSIK